MSKELRWALEKHETEMFPGSTGTNSIQEDNYTQFHKQLLNCHLAGAAKEKWKILYPETLTPQEFQEVLWKGMKTRMGSLCGEQGSRESIPGSGAWATALWKEEPRKAAGGSLRLGKGQATLTCSVVDSGFYPEDSEDQVESFQCACLSVSSAAMQAEREQGRQSSGRLREGATQWWWDRMGAVPQKQLTREGVEPHQMKAVPCKI